MSDQTEVYEPVEQEQWLGDSQELPARPRRRLLTPLPLALAGALLIACGFIGGVLVQKGQESGSSAGSPASFSALRSALGGASATRGAGGSASAGAGNFLGRLGGGATVGQVAYVRGGTLYVTNAEGNTVKVRTSEASTVSKTVKAAVGQIHPGETVTVVGEKGGGGAILARSISVGSGSGLGAFLRAGGAGGSHSGAGGAASEGQSLFGG
jgi:hypothetical protein